MTLDAAAILVVASAERVAIDGRLIGAVRCHVHTGDVLDWIGRAGFSGRPINVVNGHGVTLDAKVLGGNLGELLAAGIVSERVGNG